VERALQFDLNRITDVWGGEMIYRVFLTLIALMLASKHSLGEVVPPVLVDVPIKKVFIPRGFDNNDRVQFALTGELSNSCYKVASQDVKVDSATKVIVVKQKAYVYLGYCLMMIVPYSQVVTLGIVDQAGSYKIVDGNTGALMGNLEIDVAKSSDQDEFLYAPVEDVILMRGPGSDKKNDTNRNRLMLMGAFSNTCTEFKEIQVAIDKDTIVIRPIIIFHSEANHCRQEKVKFRQPIVLDPSIQGEFLVHVRSLNGAAVNKVIDF
jgi:hypothetical protein